MSNVVSVEAPAKVNLHLGVGAVRPDGYHDVVTVLAAVDLCDEVRLSRAAGLSLECQTDLGLPVRDNLAWKAAERLAERFGREPEVAIEVEKLVPAGAGLGGGSSDAAAVLAGLATLWGLDRREPEVEAALVEVAATLGADVPFFLSGGTALFAGRGDRFVRRIEAPRLDIVLVKPDAPVATARAYGAFDRDPLAAAPADALIRACESGDVAAVARSLENNLEEAAVGLVSDVADALAWLRSTEGVLGAAVSGSGSAVFGICDNRDAARRAAEGARRRGWWSTATASRASGVRVRLDEEAS